MLTSTMDSYSFWNIVVWLSIFCLVNIPVYYEKYIMQQEVDKDIKIMTDVFSVILILLMLFGDKLMLFIVHEVGGV